MDKESQAALTLHFYKELSPSNILELYHQVGSFADILALSNLASSNGSAAVKQKLENLDKHREQLAEKAQGVLNWCTDNQVYPLSLSHPNYPVLLKEIASPPLMLFVQGDVDLLGLPQLAIVGSRNATGSGLNTAFEFAKMLANAGFVITSGLALGIDGAAHNGALETGKTIAVLGTGSDIIYPKRHVGLQQKILEQGGAVVTEFIPGTPPLPAHFPRRNRIISGLSLGTMVVEAALKSGSLITAKYAMEQGREVFAVPGSIHNVFSKGAHSLLKQGATLVESAADIVDQLGGILGYMTEEHLASEPCPIEPAFVALPSDNINPQPYSESKPAVSSKNNENHLKNHLENNGLLNAMGFDPVDMDTLVERTGCSVVELNQQLMTLELQGMITSQNGVYSRCR